MLAVVLDQLMGCGTVLALVSVSAFDYAVILGSVLGLGLVLALASE